MPHRAVSMKRLPLVPIGLLLIFVSPRVVSQTQPAPAKAGKPKTGPRHAAAAAPVPRVCSACIRAHMEFLASDGVNPRPTAGGTPMMVHRHCHLNQPLQELLRRPGCGAPYVFQGLM